MTRLVLISATLFAVSCGFFSKKPTQFYSLETMPASVFTYDISV